MCSCIILGVINTVFVGETENGVGSDSLLDNQSFLPSINKEITTWVFGTFVVGIIIGPRLIESA
jgi:hypothetical protein|tara:strand:- start:265 stop:456 length:192 start_codon:yes stop_codon:yes gene_type:complete